MASIRGFELTERHKKCIWAKEIKERIKEDNKKQNHVFEDAEDFITKLNIEDVDKYGFYPCTEDLKLVMCYICKKYIKIEFYNSHITDHLNPVTECLSQADSAYGSHCSEFIPSNGSSSNTPETENCKQNSLSNSTTESEQNSFSETLQLTPNETLISPTTCDENNSEKHCDNCTVSNSPPTNKRTSNLLSRTSNKKSKKEPILESVFVCNISNNITEKAPCRTESVSPICNNHSPIEGSPHLISPASQCSDNTYSSVQNSDNTHSSDNTTLPCSSSTHPSLSQKEGCSKRNSQDGEFCDQSKLQPSNYQSSLKPSICSSNQQDTGSATFFLGDGNKPLEKSPCNSINRMHVYVFSYMKWG